MSLCPPPHIHTDGCTQKEAAEEDVMWHAMLMLIAMNLVAGKSSTRSLSAEGVSLVDYPYSNRQNKVDANSFIFSLLS